MSLRKHFLVVMALVAAFVVLPSVQTAWAGFDEKKDDVDTVDDDNDADDPALEDGKNLLSKAAISLDDAKAIALKAVPAATAVDEVDLEYVDGKLVFDVDVAGQSVHVDAMSGALLKVAADADEDESDDD
jgi:uncharacterized membrane protein YkoI